jgi:hypothetical protein
MNLYALTTLATRACRKGVSLILVTASAGEHVVKSSRASSKTLWQNMVYCPISTTLQFFLAIVTDLVLSVREISSSVVSVCHRSPSS